MRPEAEIVASCSEPKPESKLDPESSFDSGSGIGAMHHSVRRSLTEREKTIVKVETQYLIVKAFRHEAEEICNREGKVIWSPTMHQLDQLSLPDLPNSNLWNRIYHLCMT